MLKILLRIFAALPLPIIHGLGVILGWIMYLSDKKFSRRTWDNLLNAKITPDAKEHRRRVHKCIQETGKGLLESFAIWFKSPESVQKWVKACHGWEHVDAALAEKYGVIFLTPHLGCYEITAQYYAAMHPVTVLFRPARQEWLVPLIEEGRSRGQVKLAPTNMRGVRNLLKALRRGEAVGILPDQVPELGEGVWATFFGKPAYTMTLVSKLAETTQARVLLAFGERLPWGRGFVIHFEPLAAEPTPQNVNDAIERLVRTRPEQYLWSYKRFKKPQKKSTED